MKKICLMLFGAMFSLCASAQFVTANSHSGLPGMKVDSAYTMQAKASANGDIIRCNKYEWAYNDAGQQTSQFSYVYDGKGENPYICEKILTMYNEEGVVSKEENWIFATTDDNWHLYSTVEITNYDDNTGQPLVYITSTQDDKTKAEITKFHGLMPEDVDVLSYSEGDWIKSASMHFDYNADKLAKQTISMDLGMFVLIQERSYEYDNHGNVTKISEAYQPAGFFGEDTEILYENEYDNKGNLIKTTETASKTYTYYFWSEQGSSSIYNPNVGSGLSMYYDLQGRRLGTVRPTQQGIYIVNGKKISLKK